ncbi:MAG: hypothetical protein JWR17_2680 [Pseudomonas sp.]|nr:hypothetical protein [Pseudomonas sp.]
MYNAAPSMRARINVRGPSFRVGCGVKCHQYNGRCFADLNRLALDFEALESALHCDLHPKDKANHAQSSSRSRGACLRA